jgi:hypothetical protein
LDTQDGLVTGNHIEFPHVTLKVPNLKLAGQVLDHYGRPLPGAQVAMRENEGQIGCTVTTDSQGYFVFNAVCAGPASLYAWYHGFYGFHVVHPTYGGDMDALIKER